MLVYSFVVSLILGEFALALSFWQLPPTIWSLTLSTVFYILAGVISDFIKERLSRRAIAEYLGVGILIFIFLSFINLFSTF
jgi:hypothetical protein